LDGVNGNDANNGSAAAQAVKTFARAKALLVGSMGASNLIVVIGTVTIAAPGESWDLSGYPNAVVQRGLGFTGYLVTVSSGRFLTLSDITIDGDKANVNITVNAMINNASGGRLDINPGTVIRNNNNDGVNNAGSCYMSGGEIFNNRYGINNASGTARSDEFIMTGGKISNNTSYGLYNSYLKYFRMSGGEIKGNGSHGVYDYNNHPSGVIEISGTAKISENGGSGFYPNSSSYYLDSLIISGGEICNNRSYGFSLFANRVSITGGTVSDNGNRGLNLTASTAAGTSSEISGMTINHNTGYGAYFLNFNEFTMSGGAISNNTSYGLYVTGVLTNTSSVFALTGGSITGNAGYGLYLEKYAGMTVENATVSRNGNIGIVVTNPADLPGTFAMPGGEVSFNNSYGLSLNNYLTYTISGNTQINNNLNTALYSNTLQPSYVSGNVLIRGNKSTGNAGGIYVVQGTVHISDNVTLEADTCMYYAGGIYVAAAGNAVISGNVQLRDCRQTGTSATSTYGGTAIYALGSISMTGGSITGCETPASTGSMFYGRGTVYVGGASGNVTLTDVTVRDNKAGYGGAVYVNSGGKITLDTDTVINNTTHYMTANSGTAYTSPGSGAIHLAGGSAGRLSLRDKCYIDGDIFIGSKSDTVYVDEALLSSDIGAFHLLAYHTTSSSTAVTALGTVVVSPNGTTVTDASQFLTRFTLMNQGIGRGLDKGGTDDRHIMIVNQFFIDCTNAVAGNGASPHTPFNSLTQPAFLTALGSAYTTVWVSGPVFTKQATTTLPVINQNSVNLRRYTGFAVTAQRYPAYDSVMVTVEPGHTLIVEGGNSAANTFTVSGEGGSALHDASLFKNNGTLTLRGYTNLFFNPTAGNGAAVYQNGTFNLSGNVSFDVYSTNTVYLTEGNVITVPAPLKMAAPVGITVETTPANTHVSGRILVTGTAANVPPGMENLFYNEIPVNPLPVGRLVNGADADLLFYIADRNVSGVPVYTTLQDAFDAAVSASNDEVRLYGDTREAVTVSKQLRYNSRGFSVSGSFTLDSLSRVQLLDDLLTDTLYIRATTFSNKALLDMNGFSPQITAAAYLDLRLPSDALTGDWYPVNLPFDARLTDIRDAADTLRQVLHLHDFGIAEYSPLRRALHGIGNQPSNPDNDWQYFTQPTMTNGAGYMVTASDIQTLRFKASSLNLFTTATAPLTYSTGPAAAAHHGINYVAQPLSMNAMIGGDIPPGSIVQVSNSLSSDRIGAASYVPMTVNASLVIAPYTNYFYQTANSGTVTYTPSSTAATVRSGSPTAVNTAALDCFDASHLAMTGQISSDVPVYYELRFYADEPSRYDALFVAANEFASKDRYEIGRDVAKMGALGNAPQIWSKDFDVALCANEALMEDGSAFIPLYIHTPAAGKEYMLKLQNKVNGREQLWLCRAGKPIQNLTETPSFTVTGTGDTTEEYSLRILSGVTANKPFDAGAIYVYAEKNAIIINGLQPNDAYQVYDISGRLHATGKAPASRTRIYTAPGAYLVQTNGLTFKVTVK
jgi:hypothetical protein